MIIDAIQQQIMHGLLSEGVKTRYGKEHGFEQIQLYHDFKERVPLTLYSDIEDQVERIKQGATDLFWPGRVTRFAVSSGTTGMGKHLPITKDRLFFDRNFMKQVMWSYLRKTSNPFRLMGKHLSLPGSLEQRGELLFGEISGFSALHTPALLRPFQVADPRDLASLPFREKFNRVLEQSIEKDIRVIIAVPSWMLTLFQQVLDRTGKSHIGEVWPNLKLLVCGGVKLANYRPHLEKLAGNPGLDFIETYGASEGYFAYSTDTGRDDMKLVYDNGIFYEFIPDPLPASESLAIQPTLPLWEVETGTPYAMVVTTGAGLWRYAMTDIVEFTSVDPPRIRVLGRLGEVLDRYGEALEMVEAERVLNEASREMDLEAGAFAVGSRLDSEHDLPRHHWFVHFGNRPIHTQTLERLAGNIDERLQQVNRHYAIRRESNALDKPVVHDISQNDINAWFEWSERSSAQGKLPRMLPDTTDLEFFLNR